MAQLKYSKSKIDNAGITLCTKNTSDSARNEALEILSSWRAMHSHPMDTFKRRLQRVSLKVDTKALTAQRLKRVPSIIKKLKRKYDGAKATMKLTQMQDIAGCRVILSDVKLAEEVYNNHYLNSKLKHTLVNEKNYILEPKKDGYRSIHLVYRYKSDVSDKYNGLLVEVQIRSHLQHLWATAAETVGFFTGRHLKLAEGEKGWNEFFKLVSSAFAKLEHTPQISGTPVDEKELYLEIKKKAKQLEVKRKMTNWTKSIKLFDVQRRTKSNHFFLLELDTIQEKLVYTAYSDRQETKAIEDYARVEKNIYGRPEYDAVLVGANTVEDLKRAYPNYFLDTREFLKYLDKIVNKYE